MKIVFVLANSADTDLMPLDTAFIWVVTVYPSTCLPVSRKGFREKHIHHLDD